MTARDKLDELKILWGLRTDEDLAKKINVQKTNLDVWIRRKKIPEKWELKISQMTNNESKKELISSQINQNIYEIDVLSLKAGAGGGVENYIVEVIDTIMIDKSLFRTPINQNSIKCIQVDGDSMEPTLKNEDFVLIDTTQKYGVDGIYAINLHNQILIKRLEFNLDGTISIISDNSNYKTKISNPKDSQIPL